MIQSVALYLRLKPNEITSSLNFNGKTKQSAVSLLQFSYDLVFSTMRDEESSDLSQTPRVYLHRANILMPLLRLMRSRATVLFTGAMMKFIAKLNSTASRYSQRGGV